MGEYISQQTRVDGLVLDVAKFPGRILLLQAARTIRHVRNLVNSSGVRDSDGIYRIEVRWEEKERHILRSQKRG